MPQLPPGAGDNDLLELMGIGLGPAQHKGSSPDVCNLPAPRSLMLPIWVRLLRPSPPATFSPLLLTSQPQWLSFQPLISQVHSHIRAFALLSAWNVHSPDPGMSASYHQAALSSNTTSSLRNARSVLPSWMHGQPFSTP